MNTLHRRGLAVLAVALATIFSVTSAGAALNTYLTLEGGNQGQIEGDVDEQGREGTILVTEIHHLMHFPIDPGTGQVTGALQHEPFVFTKAVDKATVGMYIALSNNESLTATFKYYKIDPGSSAEVQYFTVKLENARIIAIEPIKAETRDPASAIFPDMERIRMTYQRVTITNEEHAQEVQIDIQSQP